MKNGLLIATGFIAVAAWPATASVLFTTGLGTGNDPAFTASGSHHDVQLQVSAFGQYLELAEPFTVTDNSTATDLLVALSLTGSSAPFNNGPVLDFSIVSDVSGLPDSDPEGNPTSALYSGAATGITGVAGAIYDVSLSGSGTLVAGNTYWIIAKEPGVSPAPGCSVASPCTSVYDEWYNNNSSLNTAADLSDFEDGWGVPNQQSDLAVTVLGTAATSATPEPSSLILIATGLVFVMLGSRGFRRKKLADIPSFARIAS